MDLVKKIEDLQSHLIDLETHKKKIHEEMKETKRRISKYETVLKHAEEIEAVETQQQ